MSNSATPSYSRILVLAELPEFQLKIGDVLEESPTKNTYWILNRDTEGRKGTLGVFKNNDNTVTFMPGELSSHADTLKKVEMTDYQVFEIDGILRLKRPDSVEFLRDRYVPKECKSSGFCSIAGGRKRTARRKHPRRKNRRRSTTRK